jgi:hypothetical protein
MDVLGQNNKSSLLATRGLKYDSRGFYYNDNGDIFTCHPASGEICDTPDEISRMSDGSEVHYYGHCCTEYVNGQRGSTFVGIR